MLFDIFHASTLQIITNSLEIMYLLSGIIEKPGINEDDMKLYGFS
jgi:hypothetical protein